MDFNVTRIDQYISQNYVYMNYIPELYVTLILNNFEFVKVRNINYLFETKR